MNRRQFSTGGFWWDKDLGLYLIPTIIIGQYNWGRRTITIHWLRSYFLIYIDFDNA